MKRLTILTTLTLYFLTVTETFAQSTVVIATPAQGYKDLGLFTGNVLTILYALSVLLLLFMIVYALVSAGSGGDKEAVGKARGTIINALIGIAILSVAFALAVVAGQFLGFNNITSLTIPAPG